SSRYPMSSPIVLELNASSNDVSTQLADRHVDRQRMRPQTNHRLGDGYVELDGQHPCRLVNLGPIQLATVQPLTELAGARVGLQAQHRRGDHLGTRHTVFVLR